MKLTNLFSESREILQIAGEKLIDTPKPTLYVSAYAFAVGMADVIDWINAALPKMAVMAGFIGVVILARLNWKKTKLTDSEKILKDIEVENARMENRILREKMLKMGVELRREDDKG